MKSKLKRNEVKRKVKEKIKRNRKVDEIKENEKKKKEIDRLLARSINLSLARSITHFLSISFLKHFPTSLISFAFHLSTLHFTIHHFILTHIISQRFYNIFFSNSLRSIKIQHFAFHSSAVVGFVSFAFVFI